VEVIVGFICTYQLQRLNNFVMDIIIFVGLRSEGGIEFEDFMGESSEDWAGTFGIANVV
jgi:hypothetical protein